jgi:hypothetical protein
MCVCENGIRTEERERNEELVRVTTPVTYKRMCWVRWCAQEGQKKKKRIKDNNAEQKLANERKEKTIGCSD